MSQKNELSIDFRTGLLAGNTVLRTEKRLSQLAGLFRDETARASMDQDKVIYRVEYFFPVVEGTEGGLFWGNTTIEPGTVGDEYFMTKGHFHAIRNRGEYYVTVAGQGALVLMDESRRTRSETMGPGSVHYIPGDTAHRVANIGKAPLTFLACWPSDAGHDYATIERDGFGARVVEIDGAPRLTAEDRV